LRFGSGGQIKVNTLLFEMKEKEKKWKDWEGETGEGAGGNYY